MQFHLNGFRSGDPNVLGRAEAEATSANETAPLDTVDVLIVGCGPAGLTLAAQLSAFPTITTQIVDQKDGPLTLGQADGVACRSMEMFNAFGFVERVLKESYWVNETTFWKPDEQRPEHIVRSGQIQDTEDGLSEFPHVILNQARVHDFYLDVMRNAPKRLEPYYARRLLGLKIASAVKPDSIAHPVTATFERVDSDGKTFLEAIKARYVVGCDGARSTVRESIGQRLMGDSANQAWGVMDVLAVTDFPDIRMKTLIQSANDGSIVLIPREGGYLVRIYVEMDKLKRDERAAAKGIIPDDLIAAANKIFSPYTLDVKEIAWWSVYEIGQRLCNKFDDVPSDADHTHEPHVFIAGDACHTHSPKAGQGMNVSMRDAFNLGWKLASVILGRSTPQLLHTYSAERQKVAKTLIDFDHEWSKMVSARPATSNQWDSESVDPAEFQKYFVKHARYTAGTAIQYAPSLITGPATYQELAQGFEIGTRFHSGPVIRLSDAKPVQLGSAVKADGRWRLFAFADKQSPAAPTSSIHAFCDFLGNAAESPIVKFTRPNEDVDSVFDVRGIFQQGHRAIELNNAPSLLLPAKGRYGLRDYEKIFCPDFTSGQDIFDIRGVDRNQGCVVIVRPDQHVAHVLPLQAFNELAAFFNRFMLPAHD
jgi:phenol 2-monooxygenase (NADPH)